MKEWFKVRIIPRIIILVVFIVVIMIAYFFSDERYLETSTDEVTPIDSYENKIAITFDDGPNYKTTSRLLDGLKERGIKASFFLVGELAEKNPEIVERLSDEGHVIGNHTYSHINLSQVNFESAVNEIDKTNKIIENITGKKVKYIRPPYGIYTEQIEKSCELTPVLWTVDPDDWNTANSNSVVKCVVKNVKGNDIILLHDIYDSSVTAALEIIDELTLRGFEFVTVDDIILD